MEVLNLSVACEATVPVPSPTFTPRIPVPIPLLPPVSLSHFYPNSCGHLNIVNHHIDISALGIVKILCKNLDLKVFGKRSLYLENTLKLGKTMLGFTNVT